MDAILRIGDQRIAISALSTRKYIVASHIRYFTPFLQSMSQELQAGRLSKVFIAFDHTLRPDGRYRNAFTQFASVTRKDLVERIVLVDEADPDATIARVIQQLESLSGGEPTLKLAPKI